MDIEQELSDQIAANGELVARWFNGDLDDLTELLDLFTDDATMVNSRLPDGLAARPAFGPILGMWRGMYADDPVTSTTGLRTVMDLGDDRYLTVHVRRLENSAGAGTTPETTLFVRDADGHLHIRLIAE